MNISIITVYRCVYIDVAAVSYYRACYKLAALTYDELLDTSSSYSSYIFTSEH